MAGEGKSGIGWGTGEIVFAVVLLTALSGGPQFLSDPGTFWHARLGREILETGRVPRSDNLTFTRPNAPWVDQSWAFDVALAAVVQRWGWPAAVGLSALLLAALYGWMARELVRDGVAPIVAGGVTILAAWIGTMHFLVRPHLVTFALFAITLRCCQLQHERGGWRIAWIPPLMVVWANSHGGFLAGIIVVATAAAACAAAGPWDQQRRVEVAKFGLILAACLFAPLINPYAVGLYWHVAQFISGEAALTREFEPIRFGRGQAWLVELVVMLLIAAPTFLGKRMDAYQLAHTIVWLHLALTSIRHAPLFAIAAAPGLARLLDVSAGRSPIAASERRLGGSPWVLGTAALVLLGVLAGYPFARFDEQRWPLRTLEVLNRQPVSDRLFHEFDWGGLIESECRPPRLAFIDDRCELFGRTAVAEYVDALEGGPGWDRIRDRHRIDLVWIRPDRGLARRLEAEPGWTLLGGDEVSRLYSRSQGSLEPPAARDSQIAPPTSLGEPHVARSAGRLERRSPWPK
jgi:hypothetical protein